VEDGAIGMVRRKEKVHASGGKPPSEVEESYLLSGRAGPWC
jgi:hypothetical protein